MMVMPNGTEMISNAELPGGPLGLQHDRGRIHFRNIFLKELQ